MSKKTLIITGIIVAVITIGATAAYISLKQEGEKVRPEQPEQPVGTLPGPPELPVVQPQEPVTPPEQPTTPEPIDTSDWKTYRNEKYGFELRYPGDWYIDEWGEEDLYFPNSVTVSSGKGVVIDIYPEGSLVGMDPGEKFPKYYSEGPLTSFLTIDGHRALKKAYHFSDGSKAIIIYFFEPPNENWTKEAIIRLGTTQNSNREIPLLQEILDSFRFLP